jgi:hypothetical protein
MKSYPPPYRPLRGAEPPHFVDREDPHDPLASGIVCASMAAYAAGPRHPRFHRLIIAGPAMGKTAVLRAIGREVTGRLGWAVALHSCQPKERALRAVSAAVAAAIQQQWRTEVTVAEPGALSGDRHDEDSLPGWAAVTRFEGGLCSWAALRNLLGSAGQLARSMSRGVLIMFDDADRLGGAELDSLGYLARSLSRDGLPVALLFTGGPLLGPRFIRAGNFSGCVWPTSLSWLDDGEAREALVVPAADRGVEFDEGALELLCQVAGGSPLELQRLGFAAWSAARGAELVTLADARTALGLLRESTEARAS